MTREIAHDGRGALRVRFPYDPRLVEKVKSLPNRRWNSAEKHWWVPEDDVVALVDLLADEGFAIDETARRLYAERGGTRDLAPPAAAGGGPRPRGLFDAASPGPGGDASAAANVDWTVGRLNRAAREALEGAFPRSLWLVGEVSGFNKSAHKRHVGFVLVERAGGEPVAQVHAILFEDTRRETERKLADAGSPFRLEDEIEIRVRVRVELYDAWGQYRVRVEDLDVQYTLGEAARRREEIVRRLGEAGLLERNRSLPFPPVPLRLGVVTSLGSDAFNDVLKTLRESAFAFDVTVHGARVQGRQTEPSVLNALDWFRRRAPEFDAILICRGGGSRTDLAWFDSEALGRAVAEFPLPVIVGIGHEQDVSVLDAVGWRTKTPTAAALLVVDAVRRFLDRVSDGGGAVIDAAVTALRDERMRAAQRGARLVRAATALLDLERAELRRRRERTSAAARHVLSRARTALYGSALAVPKAAARLFEKRGTDLERSVRQLLQGARRDLAAAARLVDERRAALAPRAMRLVRAESERADARARRLHLVDPRRVVERGYAILRAAAGRLVTAAEDAPAGTRVTAELRGGTLRLTSEGPEPMARDGGHGGPR